MIDNRRSKRASREARRRGAPDAGAPLPAIVSARSRRRTGRFARGPRYLRRRPDHRRARRFALASALVALVAAGVYAAVQATAAPEDRPALVQPVPGTLVADGPPEEQVLATFGAPEPLFVPVRQGRITAIVYHATGDPDSVSLTPAGRQLNESFFGRIVRRLFGGSDDAEPGYYIDEAGSGSSTASVDVGAAAGTSVWAPISGRVVGVQPYVLDGERWGEVIQIQPDDAPYVIVTLTNVDVGARVAVGTSVTAHTTRLGTVADLSRALDQDVAKFTSDAGNHVHIEATPAPAASPLL